MKKQRIRSVGLLTAALFVAACTGPVKNSGTETKGEVGTKKETQRPAAPVAAKSAFFEMYKPARSWASDALLLSMTSGEISGMKNEGGKAAMWTAVFVSPSRREARTVFYSAADHGTFHKGVSIGGAQSWTGATPKSKPFSSTEFLVNSDAAYETALVKAGPWVKKHPDKKLSLLLASESRFSGPVWYVLWGDMKSGYLAFVNATTGNMMSGR